MIITAGINPPAGLNVLLSGGLIGEDMQGFSLVLTAKMDDGTEHTVTYDRGEAWTDDAENIGNCSFQLGYRLRKELKELGAR